VTADVLKLRSAPDPNVAIVARFRQNSETGAEAQVQNGFRKLADTQWAAAGFLKSVAASNYG
jgi:hypothetical protein